MVTKGGGFDDAFGGLSDGHAVNQARTGSVKVGERWLEKHTRIASVAGMKKG